MSQNRILTLYDHNKLRWIFYGQSLILIYLMEMKNVDDNDDRRCFHGRAWVKTINERIAHASTAFDHRKLHHKFRIF